MFVGKTFVLKNKNKIFAVNNESFLSISNICPDLGTNMGP